MWSIGMLIYWYLNSRTPFEETGSMNKLDKMISLSGVDFSKCTKDLGNLMRKLLKPNCNDRLTMDEFFRDPWVVKMKEQFSRDMGEITINDDFLRYKGGGNNKTLIFGDSIVISEESYSISEELSKSVNEPSRTGSIVSKKIQSGQGSVSR
jgi:serine/threonine protein kinase